ncbi:MAG: DUF1080 domain-containing protein [Planctomycetota bacterium]
MLRHCIVFATLACFLAPANLLSPVAAQNPAAAQNPVGNQNPGAAQNPGDESSGAASAAPQDGSAEATDNEATGETAAGETATKETAAAPAPANLPPPKVNFDKTFLGEYLGPVAASFFVNDEDESDAAIVSASDREAPAPEDSAPEDSSNMLALQLRPTGKNRFDALLYRGGLPGAEGCQLQSDEQLIGLRSGDTLVLSGSKVAIFVDSTGCTLVDADGNRLGRLDRVQRKSRTLGAVPPEGAIVIFDGTDTEELLDGQMNDDGWLKFGTMLMPMTQDFDLHLEFRLPLMSGEDGQARGNSGVYLQSRYECQILDSFAKKPVFNGCGSLYRFKAPDVNTALPPLQWQTYDIRFTSPRWSADGTKRSDARVSSYLNGVLVQDDVSLSGPTGNGKDESPTLLPTKLQDHKDEVWFRNVWMIDRSLTPGIDFPIEGEAAEKSLAEAE